MRELTFSISDPLGIHARPAGLLTKAAKKFSSKITIEKDGKTADMTKLFALMGLGVKKGDTVKVTVEGDDEETAAAEIEKFFAENF